MMTLLFCPPSGLHPSFLLIILYCLYSTLFYRTLLCPFSALFAEMVDAQCGLCLWAARKTARWWEKLQHIGCNENVILG